MPVLKHFCASLRRSWIAGKTQGGRRSKERGWDGDGTETGRSRSRYKNVSITINEPVFYISSNKLKTDVV
jgi:hypothetical protein